MNVERHTIAVTTDASGDATKFSPVVTGRILNVIYTKDGTAPFAAGVDFTVTLEATGQTVWGENNVDASKTVAPRQPTHGTDGAAALYAAAGEPIEDVIYAAKDRVKIVVSSGGDSKVGSFIVVVG